MLLNWIELNNQRRRENIKIKNVVKQVLVSHSQSAFLCECTNAFLSAALSVFILYLRCCFLCVLEVYEKNIKFKMLWIFWTAVAGLLLSLSYLLSTFRRWNCFCVSFILHKIDRLNKLQMHETRLKIVKF